MRAGTARRRAPGKSGSRARPRWPGRNPTPREMRGGGTTRDIAPLRPGDFTTPGGGDERRRPTRGIPRGNPRRRADAAQGDRAGRQAPPLRQQRQARRRRGLVSLPRRRHSGRVLRRLAHRLFPNLARRHRPRPDPRRAGGASGQGRCRAPGPGCRGSPAQGRGGKDGGGDLERRAAGPRRSLLSGPQAHRGAWPAAVSRVAGGGRHALRRFADRPRVRRKRRNPYPGIHPSGDARRR